MAKPKRPSKRSGGSTEHVRDAGTGRYAKPEEAKRRPKETVTETDKPKPKPKSKRKAKGKG